MKLLYIYDDLPQIYQEYMSLLLDSLKNQINLKSLTYTKSRGDYSINSYGIKDSFQRFIYKLKLSKYSSLDVKKMSSFDIIHLQHSYLFTKLFPLFKNGGKTKIVITLRGGDTYVKPWVYEKWKMFYKMKSQYIDAFITVSNHQKEYLQKWGVPKDKIHIIPVSFGDKSICKPKYPSNEVIKIISAHRMCWEKNIEGNLRTIKLLKDKGQTVQYDIFGDGPDSGQVYYLIDKYGLENEVNYMGKIENSIFKEKLIDYDFFLQLSHSEAFGVSVIEAQSKGVPCIVSNSDGLPEAIINKKSGYCVEPYAVEKAVDCILKLSKNPELYFSFSTAAIKHVNSNFTVSHEVKRLKTLYNKLLN